MRKKGKKIILLFSIVFICFILGFKPKKKQKLLMYITTTENLLELSFYDTSNIPNICIKLHIDTINMDWIIECKKKRVMEKMFVFQDHIFYKHQLFNLDEYDKLKKYHLTPLGIVSGLIDGHMCDSTCTGDQRSRFIIEVTKRRVKKYKKKGRFFISASAVTDNENDPEIEMNDIGIWILPSVP